MRKIDIDMLPTKNGRIDWKNCIGHEVFFIYDDIQGSFKIIDYNRPYLLIFNEEYNIKYKIGTSSITSLKLNSFIRMIKYKKELNRYIKISNKLGRGLSKTEFKLYNFNFHFMQNACKNSGYSSFKEFKDKNNIVNKIKGYDYLSLIRDFNKYYKLYDKIPSQQEIKNSDIFPSTTTVNNTLKKYNINIDSIFNIISGNYNITYKEYLYNIKLKEFKKVCLINGVPIVRQINNKDYLIQNCPNTNVYNYETFCKWCGFNNKKDYSKQQIINMVLNKQKELNRPIQYNDFRNSEVTINDIKKYWNTLNDMKKDLKIRINQENMTIRHKTKEQMINDIKQLTKELGKVPTTKDINECKYCLNTPSYDKYFGGINNVYNMLGYTPNKKSISLNLTNKEIIKIYQDYFNKSNTVFGSDYCRNIYKLPSPTTVLRRFDCTWNNFISLLGFEPNNKFYNKHISSDGVVCNSNAELIIHEFLLTLNIENLRKEVLYKEILTNKKLCEEAGLKRLDWTFEYNNKEYYIEYFGMMGTFDYNKKHDEKLSLIKRDNKENTFIKLYPKDIKKLDKIFSFVK